MSYTILDEAIDAIAVKIEDGESAEQAVEDAVAEFNILSEELIDHFEEAYLCTPKIYEQNISNDNLTEKEDLAAINDLEIADLDETIAVLDEDI